MTKYHVFMTITHPGWTYPVHQHRMFASWKLAKAYVQRRLELRGVGPFVGKKPPEGGLTLIRRKNFEVEIQRAYKPVKARRGCNNS